MDGPFHRIVDNYAWNGFRIESGRSNKKYGKLYTLIDMPTTIKDVVTYDIGKWVFVYRWVKKHGGFLNDDTNSTAYCAMYSGNCDTCPVLCSQMEGNFVSPCGKARYANLYRAGLGWIGDFSFEDVLKRLDIIFTIILFDLELAVMYGSCTLKEKELFIKNFINRE